MEIAAYLSVDPPNRAKLRQCLHRILCYIRAMQKVCSSSSKKRITATKLRKVTSKAVRMAVPESREVLAAHIKHAIATSNSYYNIAKTRDNAIPVTKLIDSIICPDRDVHVKDGNKKDVNDENKGYNNSSNIIDGQTLTRRKDDNEQGEIWPDKCRKCGIEHEIIRNLNVICEKLADIWSGNFSQPDGSSVSDICDGGGLKDHTNIRTTH
ncbi:Hypothetical predicted protein [Mytilus galloprovincialis]|uniref:Uncharacterized protein n=1 Tax=Mytilus galloprovincialis TaxID=29158 RepID=A0A8B6CND4_MYTGA|nr:Hypothetical predicted protein [Mytilus galloprovincialis]